MKSARRNRQRVTRDPAAPAFVSLEHAPGPFEEPLAERVFLAAAEVGEFLQLRPLGGRQPRGHLDRDAHVQIPMPIALHILDALALEAKHRAGLNPGGDLDRGRPVQSGNLHLRPQRRLNKTDRHLTQQVISLPLKEGMGLDMEHDV